MHIEGGFLGWIAGGGGAKYFSLAWTGRSGISTGEEMPHTNNRVAGYRGQVQAFHEPALQVHHGEVSGQ